MSKPPELIHLYREGLKQTGQSGVTVATQTDQIQDEKDDIILEQVNLWKLLLFLKWTCSHFQF